MFVRTTAAAAGLTLSAALLISPWTVSATGVTPAVARADGTKAARPTTRE